MENPMPFLPYNVLKHPAFRYSFMEEREQLIQTLLKHFYADLKESILPFTHEETINVVQVLTQYLKGVYQDEPAIPEYYYEGNPFDGETFIEEQLLKPYRQKMAPFVKTQLKYYFGKDDYTKSLLFQKLSIQDTVLSDEEYQDYIFRIYTVLQKVKESLYLMPVEKTFIPPIDVPLLDSAEDPESHGFKSKSTEYTRSRQVLLYYFVLKLMGMTKLDNSSRKYAQFAHVLFAYPIDNIDNSAIYKLLKKAPYLKKDQKELLKDYEFVKNQFELIGSVEGVALVQKEIDLLRRWLQDFIDFKVACK